MLLWARALQLNYCLTVLRQNHNDSFEMLAVSYVLPFLRQPELFAEEFIALALRGAYP